MHEKSVDTWYVLKGSARFILGGQLKDPTSKKPGEWLGRLVLGYEDGAVRIFGASIF